MHTYEAIVGGEPRTIEAETWWRDFDTHEVVFTRRRRIPNGTLIEEEVARLYVEDPHRHIRRLTPPGAL